MTDWGSDISTEPDLDPFFAVQTGPRVLLEAIARRLMTPPGMLPEDPEYGYDARQLFNGTYSPAELAREERRMAAQCEMDERVLGADVRIAFEFQTGEARVSVRLLTADGPFDLVLGISEAVAVLLSSSA
jgi:hypothetical protein